MRRGDKKNKKEEMATGNYRKWLKSGWFTFFGLLILFLITWPLLKNMSQEKSLESDITSAQAEIKKYEGENQKLQELINYLGSDQAVEDKAKLNLGMKKAGEKVVVIQENAPAVASGDENNSSSTNNFSRWYQYFFH